MLFTLSMLACTPSGGPWTAPGVMPATAPPSDSGATSDGLGLRFVGSPPRNLLFLSIDTFRKDHTGFHGNAQGLTPFLDELAARGVVLDDHVQCSNWTYASTTCTLAGRTSVERGQMPRLSGDETTRTRVPEGTMLLAGWLADAGYTTALVSGNAWLGPGWGNGQGYQLYGNQGGNAFAVHERGVELLAGVDTPWFLHLHFMEPHASYDPPEQAIVGAEELPPWPEDLTVRPTHYHYRDSWPQLEPEDQETLEAHLRVLYEGEIRTIDYRLREIWAALDAEGRLDDTLVVIWNDHGEQFWEHGDQTHAYKLHAEENDGFALFWAKNLVPGRHAGPTASIDLVPTVLDTLGLEVPPEVTGHVLGTAPDGRSRFGEVVARRGALVSVIRDGWKMMYSFSGRVVVHDRGTDPTEVVDLFDPTDPWQLELWAELKPYAEAMAPLIVQPGPTLVWPEDLP